jgi:hypothetical protein
MSEKIIEQMVLNLSNPANEYGRNNLRDLILVLHESGKTPNTIYNVLHMIGVEKQKAFEAIEMYIPKTKIEENSKMGLKEKLEASKEILSNLDKLSSEDDSLKKVAKELSEDITMMIGKEKAKMKKEKAKNTEVKLDLKGKLSSLKALTESLGNNFSTSSLKSIVEKYMKIVNSPAYTQPAIAKGLVFETRDYMWIEPVAAIVNEVSSVLESNKVSIQIEEAYSKLKSSNRNQYFSAAFPVLEELLTMEETEVLENGGYALSSHTWIPEIKAIVEHINYLNKDLSADVNHVINKKYSAVVEHNGGFVFNVNGSSYIVKDGEINTFDARTLGAAYLTMIAVQESAKFSDNKMTFYKGNHIYEVVLNESGRSFMVDNRQLLFSEKSQLKNLLVSTCHFDVNEMHGTDVLVAAYEHADKFVELDFVQNIQPRHKSGVVVNVMRLNENIYINKINTAMKTNNFIKAESATKAVEIVKEFINYDITSSVQDLLEEDVKKTVIVESRKNEILDKINFLKEQKSVLAKEDVKNEYIVEANKLITEEIEKLQSDFNSIL